MLALLLLLLLLLLPGLVEAWAGGASWQEIMADTSIDDGDMARLLARTADMLKQVRLCMRYCFIWW
jgi:superfamily II RNA helicase